jgi:hypothetical protein
MNYLKNGFNWVHLFGSCTLACILSKFFQFDAIIYTACLGVLWELADEIYSRLLYDYLDWLLDKNGFDLRDIIMNLIGLALAAWIITT